MKRLCTAFRACFDINGTLQRLLASPVGECFLQCVRRLWMHQVERRASNPFLSTPPCQSISKGQSKSQQDSTPAKKEYLQSHPIAPTSRCHFIHSQWVREYFFLLHSFAPGVLRCAIGSGLVVSLFRGSFASLESYRQQDEHIIRRNPPEPPPVGWSPGLASALRLLAPARVLANRARANKENGFAAPVGGGPCTAGLRGVLERRINFFRSSRCPPQPTPMLVSRGKCIRANVVAMLFLERAFRNIVKRSGLAGN